MKWYYAEGGKQIGPVEESALDDLVRQGVVRDDTLVWREGMAAWQRHAAVRGSSNPSPAAPPPPPAAGRLPQDAREYPLLLRMRPGGPSQPADQLRGRVGLYAVPAGVFPALERSPRHFGGFWMRFLAVIIDAIILGVVSAIIRIPLGLAGMG